MICISHILIQAVEITNQAFRKWISKNNQSLSVCVKVHSITLQESLKILHPLYEDWKTNDNMKLEGKPPVLMTKVNNPQNFYVSQNIIKVKVFSKTKNISTEFLYI